ncbi:DEAD/DEAH box helicase, partial [Candidatus Kaiserbacteria bacterium]|nr:DEAD/DEAH box helicase [Candidatus Kaiserbacteria bacterium]
MRIDISRFINKGSIVEEETRFTPENPFASLPIDARIKHTIAQKGYVTPTPIQDQAIPHILRGRDIV